MPTWECHQLMVARVASFTELTEKMSVDDVDWLFESSLIVHSAPVEEE